MTAEELRSLLDYDPETGVLTWRNRSAICLRVGDVAGHKNRSGYREIKIGYRAYLAHRLAWLHVHGEWPKCQIDHINGVRDDNRLSNLRDASRTENLLNRHRPQFNKIGFPGVYMKRGRFGARLIVNGKAVYLGVHDTPEQAHEAYQRARKEHCGFVTQSETPEQRRIRELEAKVQAYEMRQAA